jgi:replicative DNA helicase
MEFLVLKQLVENKHYTRKVLPFLKDDFFDDFEDRFILKVVKGFVSKYKKIPTYTVLKLAAKKSNKLNEKTFESVIGRIDEISKYDNEDFDLDYLIDETEEWCKNKALENAVIKSADILHDGNENKTQIHDLVKDALKVSFDTRIGVDYFDEQEISDRWDRYRKVDIKFPSGVEKLDRITKGGFKKKSLSVYLAGTHGGKTAAKISNCSHLVKKGYNALYISLEIDEDEISKRIDANLLNVKINDVDEIPKDEYESRLKKLKKEKGYGDVFVRELPTSVGSCNHIRLILEELKLKKDFIPDVIFVDYINIMASTRFTKMGDSYAMVKAIAEELRGLAVEYDVAIVTSTQTNRGGYNSSDLDMADTAESFGLPQTADLMIALISNEELYDQGIQIWKILKNRLTGIVNFRFTTKTEFEYSRITSVDDSEEDKIENSDKNKAFVEKLNTKQKKEKIKVNTEVEEEIDDLLEGV